MSRMHRESSQSPRQSLMKRKRRTSENSPASNDENTPINEEKKPKTEGRPYESGEPSTSGLDVECERLPLSELSLFDRKTSAGQLQISDDERSIADLICEQERLSISNCGSAPPSVESTITDICSPNMHELSEPEDEVEQDVEDYNEEEDEEEEDVVELPYESYYDVDDTGESCRSQNSRYSDSTVSCEPSTSQHSSGHCYGPLTPASLAASTPSSSREITIPERSVILPHLKWADSKELWKLMCDKDSESLNYRQPNYFSHHPNLQPRMRAVLLDWIIEVCEVYRCHRETYYLTMDYLDRYLSAREDVPKAELQLIGITCLLIASKVEEIYPPKVADFAYVTDGACTEDEILKMELAVLKTLNWKLSPVTINNWLSTYLQLCYKDNARHDLGFVFSQFSGQLFTRVSQLIDLATLEVGCLNFSYSVLAVTCLYLACSKQLALRVSKMTESKIRPCVQWMQAFWEVLQEEVPEQRDYRPSVVLPPGPNKTNVLDDNHNIQIHTVSLKMLEAAQVRLELMISLNEENKYEKKSDCDLVFLTPPSSSQKQTSEKSATAGFT